MNLTPLVVLWALLATVVLILAFYRKSVARKEEDYLRLDAQANQNQQVVSKKLEAIDKWGKLLTIVAAVFAVVLLGAFLYNGWVGGNTISQ